MSAPAKSSGSREVLCPGTGESAGTHLVIAWHLLTRNQPDTDLRADYFLERQHSEAYRNRLVRQLERMGHKVKLRMKDPYRQC